MPSSDTPKAAPPKPTEAELEILQALWRRGPSTVREVLAEIGRDPQPGYTTILKLLQIMTEKGLVERDERERAHVYRARQAQAETQRGLLADLLDRAFGGSQADLVLAALSSRRASDEELAEIRRLLDTYEAQGEPKR